MIKKQRLFTRQLCPTWLIIRVIPLPLILLWIRTISLILAPFSWTSWQLSKKGFLKGWYSRLRVGYLFAVGKRIMPVWYGKFGRLQKIIDRIQLINPAYLEEARQSGRGLIIVTIHSHHFRLFQEWINQKVPNLNPYLIKRFPSPQRKHRFYSKNQFLHEQQKTIFNNRLINKLKPIQAVRVLQNKGTVIAAQDVLANDVEPLLFLGQKLRNPLGAARMAEMTQALILPAILVDGGKFNSWKLHFWPLIDPLRGEPREELLQAIEKLILTYPETWLGWKQILFSVSGSIKQKILQVVLFGVRILAIPQALISITTRRLKKEQFFKINTFKALKLGYLQAIASKEQYIFYHRPKHIPFFAKKVSVFDAENLETALQYRSGIILVTVDIYSFPVLAFWLNQILQNRRKLYLLKGAPEPIPDPNWMTFQKRLLYNIENNKIRKVASILQSQQAVLTLIQKKESGLTPFYLFGRRMMINLDIIDLARRTNSIILPVIMTNSLWGNKRLVRFWPVIQPDAETAEVELTSTIEAMIKTYPEAWTQWRSLC